MKLLVTGASGFLGRHVLADALSRDHQVRALVRGASSADALEHWGKGRLEVIVADLRDPATLTDAVHGMDCVIHAAAARSGSMEERLADTVQGTKNLLDAMSTGGVRRIAHVSSFALYDYLRRRSHALIDEDSPLEAQPTQRHAYCETKLMQERLVVQFAEQHSWTWTVLRPGVIFGRDSMWVSRLGYKKKRVWVLLGTSAPLPLTYAENCAEAIVLAAVSDAAAGQVFNIVDDETPTQRTYAADLRRRSKSTPRMIPIPWVMLRSAARIAWTFNMAVCGGRLRLPTLLVPASIHANSKPMRYTNRKLKERLGWRPTYSYEESLNRCFDREVG